MSTHDNDWKRLIAAARRAPDDGDARSATAPHGFATRVLAAARAAERVEGASLFERYARRALGVSCLLAIVCVAASVKPILAAIEDETVALSETSTESESTDLS